MTLRRWAKKVPAANDARGCDSNQLEITRSLVDEAARVIAGARASSDELRELADGGSVREVLVDLSRRDGPAEVADLVLLLASDRASNVTGADFVIDGGLVTTL
jgi:hypothetical protein